MLPKSFEVDDLSSALEADAEECSKLSYLADHQIRLRRIRKRNHLASSKETATGTSSDNLNSAIHEDASTDTESPEKEKTANSDPEHSSKLIEVGVGSEEALKNVNERSRDPAEIKGPDHENNPSVNDPVRKDLKKSKYTGPVKLEPVYPEHDDIRVLLNFAREKGLNTPPIWQREGNMRINEVLHSLSPLTTPLVAISFPLQFEISSAQGASRRLIQIYLWFAGLAIGSFQPRSDPDFQSLIFQLRTPMRRIQKLNAQIRAALTRPFKKLRRWLKPLVKEMNQEVYNYTLRMTPLPASITLLEKFEAFRVQERAARAAATKNRLQRHLLVTSFSTILVISAEGEVDLGSRKVNDLSQKGSIYLIQAILSAIEDMLKKIKLSAESLEHEMETRSGQFTKVSIKRLVKQLKTMRSDRGLRYVTTTRQLAETLKSLELEVSLLVQVMEDVRDRVHWIEEAIQLALNEAERWMPEFWRQRLRLPKQRFWADCYNRQAEGNKTFEQAFPAEDFGQACDSFQIRVPVRPERMNVIFSDQPLHSFEIDINLDEVMLKRSEITLDTSQRKSASHESASILSAAITPSSSPVPFKMTPPSLLIF